MKKIPGYADPRITRLLNLNLTLILVGVIVLMAGRIAAAQSAVTVKVDGVEASGFPRVTAHATIIDESGLPILGLTADRFELVEDGQASFPPDTVETIKNDKAAVSVLILIDLGGTMNGKPLQAAKESTAKFLEKLLNEGNDPDKAAFIGFGRNVDIKAVTLTEGAREVPFTNDMGRLLNVVNFLEVEQGTGTPLYDAVYRAIKIMAQESGRRAIIVMTDGSDVGSALKEDDPIDEARRQHIPVFPIGLSNTRLDKTYLNRLAELTGGQYQEAPTPDELGQKFDEVLAQIKIQYRLTYQSRLHVDGQYHSLLLRVTTNRGQGFDEAKFQLIQAAAPSPPAPTSAPQPLATPPIAKGETGMLDGIMTWIGQNTLLAIGIIGAALLLLLMLIVFVILLIRRRSAQPEPAWGESSAYPPAPAWPSGATSPRVDYPQPGAAGGVGLPTSAAPLGGLGPSSTEAGTQIASGAPPTSSPFGVPPAAPPIAPPPAERPAPKPAAPEAPAGGGTVVIQRGPKPKLLGMLVDRKQSSRRYDIEKTTTLGRAPGNTIVLDHPTVSRQHATIKLEGGEFRLYDLGSANGTFVGDQASGAGKRLREPVTLVDGMLVRFGELEFTFKRVSLE